MVNVLANTAVKTENLSKSFGSIRAVSNLNFSIEKNELFGFIGPDGAGKTTLFRLIVSLLLPDIGKAEVFGLDANRDFRKLRKIIGYMPGRFSLYQDLTVYENLKFYASVFKTSIKENYYLIKDIFELLEPFKNRLAGNLSGGMKQKLALSCALIHKPKLLVLDEPTTGVDAISRQEFWDVLFNLKKEGITILVSTPYMDEADKCDRIALFHKGEISKIATPKQVVAKYDKKILAIKIAEKYQAIQALNDHPDKYLVYPAGENINFIGKSNRNDRNYTEQIVKYLLSKNLRVKKITPIIPNIEDCFIELSVDK